MKNRLPARVVGPLLLSACVPVYAHDTWVVATPAALEARATVRLEVTSGMAFPALESGISPERVTRAMFRVGGTAQPLPAPLPTRQALRYSLPIREPGVAAIWLQLAPRALDLEPRLIDEYLREIGAADTVGPRWRARPDPKKWHEVYRKHAKTFVRVGVPSVSDASWREPIGMELELLPESDPTTLSPGNSFSLVLLKDGRPLAGLAVAAERGKKELRKRSFETSDASGRVRFTLDRSGPWLFAATELRERGADWESDFTTLTVVVGPSPSAPGR
jgi:hypothetical protein